MALINSEMLLRECADEIRALVRRTAETGQRTYAALLTREGVTASVAPVLQRLKRDPSDARYRFSWIGPWDSGGMIWFDHAGRPLQSRDGGTL